MIKFKFYIIFSLLIFSLGETVHAGSEINELKVINLQTEELSMIMTVGKDSTVYFQYFGRKIDDASPYFVSFSLFCIINSPA